VVYIHLAPDLDIIHLEGTIALGDLGLQYRLIGMMLGLRELTCVASRMFTLNSIRKLLRNERNISDDLLESSEVEVGKMSMPLKK
jgi:hypothetical protein